MAETTTRPLVLVIDDDEGIREGIVDLLEEEGFSAVGAANGLDALNFLAESKRKPSLILLDLMMPVLDGWTFCKVRQGVSMLMEIPVVAISAAPMNGPHEPLRVDATLPKPFDPEALAWLATRMAGRKSFYGPRH
jgi:CheY-like chemotaxis protein